MTLYTLLQECRAIAEDHDAIQYTEIGHEWDISAQEENYMAMWLETPVVVSYIRSQTKQYSMAINVLQLCDDYDNLDAVIQLTSDCEDVGDDIIHALTDRLKSIKAMISITDVQAVSLRHFTTADLVGMRYDITFNVQSNYCSYPSKMSNPDG